MRKRWVAVLVTFLALLVSGCAELDIENWVDGNGGLIFTRIVIRTDNELVLNTLISPQEKTVEAVNGYSPIVVYGDGPPYAIEMKADLKELRELGLATEETETLSGAFSWFRSQLQGSVASFTLDFPKDTEADNVMLKQVPVRIKTVMPGVIIKAPSVGSKQSYVHTYETNYYNLTKSGLKWQITSLREGRPADLEPVPTFPGRKGVNLADYVPWSSWLPKDMPTSQEKPQEQEKVKDSTQPSPQPQKGLDVEGFGIDKVTFTNQGGLLVIGRGEITNNTVNDVSSLLMTLTVYDSQDNILDTGTIVVNGLRAGQTKVYETLFTQITNTNQIAKYRFQVDLKF